MTWPSSARRELVALLGEEAVLTDATHRRVYDADAYPLDRVDDSIAIFV